MGTDVIRDKLREALGEGPATSDELHQKIKELENPKQLANLLYNMKKAGEIDRNEERQYYLLGVTPKARRAVEPRPERKKREKKPGRAKVRRRANGTAQVSRPATSRAAAGLARALLENLADQAQRSLDEYIYSVCDKQTLGRLTAIRDTARANLNEFLADEA